MIGWIKSFAIAAALVASFVAIIVLATLLATQLSSPAYSPDRRAKQVERLAPLPAEWFKRGEE